MIRKKKAVEIFDELLHCCILLPGTRDSNGRPVLLFPDSERSLTYDQLKLVALYLLTIPNADDISKGVVILIDGRGGDWEMVQETFLLLQDIQASDPGRIVVIYILIKFSQKFLCQSALSKVQIGIEVKVHTFEELTRLIPITSLPLEYGGQFDYDHIAWVKFRLHVEPFLSDCNSMGTRIADIVKPLADVEAVLAGESDTNLVREKYISLKEKTMKDLHMENLLVEGTRLIERYQAAAEKCPDMEDTLSNVKTALTHLKQLQAKVEGLASVGQTRAEGMTNYYNFKRNLDNVSSEISTTTKQVELINEDGLYDVCSVEGRRGQLNKHKNIIENLGSRMKQHTALTDALRQREAEKDLRSVNSSYDVLCKLYNKKKNKLEELLAFHRLIEECMSWFFTGIQKFTAQPVMSCTTLEGICTLEEELDRHLNHCPIQGYNTLDAYGTTIGTRPVTGRIKLIKTKFGRFEDIISKRQEYLKKLKLNLLEIPRGLPDTKTTSTGLHIREYSLARRRTQSTQFDRKDLLGTTRNSYVQTTIACSCSNDRVQHMSYRVSALETRLSLADRAINLPINTSIREQLTLILRRINIIENYLKRLRFSTLYNSFYDHPEKGKRMCRTSSEILLDLQSEVNDMLEGRVSKDSGFISRPNTDQTILLSDTSLHPPISARSTPISPRSNISPSPTPSTGTSFNESEYLLETSSSGTSTPIGSTNHDTELMSRDLSTPIGSVRQYFRNKTTSPLSTDSTPLDRRYANDSLNEKLADIEKLLIELEYEVEHDLKIDNSSQTLSTALSDSGSQTESDSSEGQTTASDCEDVGVQNCADTVSSSTQSPNISFKTQCSQYETSIKDTASQHQPDNSTIGLQHVCDQTDVSIQNCEVMTESGTQHDTTVAQISSQTHIPHLTSAHTQHSIKEEDDTTQTEMIGLFVASVQTNIKHYAAKYSQTPKKGVKEKSSYTAVSSTENSTSTDIRSLNTAGTMADLKPTNHKMSAANIKPMNDKESTASIRPSESKLVGTEMRSLEERGTGPPLGAIVCDVSTNILVLCDTTATQTELFNTVNINTEIQTDVEVTLIPSDLRPTVESRSSQTTLDTVAVMKPSGLLISHSTPDLSKRSDLRHFKDVHYNINKTHELRVARIKARAVEELDKYNLKNKKKKVSKSKRGSRTSPTPSLEEDCTCEEQHSPDLTLTDTTQSSIMEPDTGLTKPDTGLSKPDICLTKPDISLTKPDTSLTKPDIPTTSHLNISNVESIEELPEEESSEEDEGEHAVLPTEAIPSPIVDTRREGGLLEGTSLPKKLQYVLFELVDTEEIYVRDLTYVVEHYIDPMESSEDESVIKLADVIFPHFRQIQIFHTNTFKSSLLRAVQSEQPLREVATTFTKHEQELAVYLSFMVHERESHRLLEITKGGVVEQLQQQNNDMLGLSAHILKPTQRMVKYKQFLDIMLAGAELFDEVEEVSHAQTLISNILQTSNNLCHFQALEMSHNLTTDITGELLKQEKFDVVIDNGTKRARRVFLFECMIIISKEQAGTLLKYLPKYSVGMDEVGLTPYSEDDPLKCIFYTSNTRFTLLATSTSVADTWHKGISHILWGQLKQIKRNRDLSRAKKSRGKAVLRGKM